MTWIFLIALGACIVFPLIFAKDEPKPEAEDYPRLMAQSIRIRVVGPTCREPGRTHFRYRTRARR